MYWFHLKVHSGYSSVLMKSWADKRKDFFVCLSALERKETLVLLLLLGFSFITTGIFSIALLTPFEHTWMAFGLLFQESLCFLLTLCDSSVDIAASTTDSVRKWQTYSTKTILRLLLLQIFVEKKLYFKVMKPAVHLELKP